MIKINFHKIIIKKKFMLFLATVFMLMIISSVAIAQRPTPTIRNHPKDSILCQKYYSVNVRSGYFSNPINREAARKQQLASCGLNKAGVSFGCWKTMVGHNCQIFGENGRPVRNISRYYFGSADVTVPDSNYGFIGCTSDPNACVTRY